MIPANIDHVAIIKELNRWGICDAKIENICGFSQGYVRHAKSGNVSQMIYQRAARLFNFWAEEARARQVLEPIQHLVASS